MESRFNLIKNKRVAFHLAMMLINIALMISIFEFVMQCIQGYFNFEYLFAFIFEVVTNGALIYALSRRKTILIELALVILKVFEATYYPLVSCERLDNLLTVVDVPRFYIVTHVLFAASAFSLLIALLFFCVYKLRDKISFWDAMKICVLIASTFLAVTTVLYIVEISRDSNMNWIELLEPLSLTFLFSGMFFTYEYVEEETILNEETHSA